MFDVRLTFLRLDVSFYPNGTASYTAVYLDEEDRTEVRKTVAAARGVAMLEQMSSLAPSADPSPEDREDTFQEGSDGNMYFGGVPASAKPVPVTELPVVAEPPEPPEPPTVEELPFGVPVQAQSLRPRKARPPRTISQDEQGNPLPDDAGEPLPMPSGDDLGSI